MCPKCSADKWSGPRFAVVVGGEALVYTCMSCGYKRLDPTHDQKKGILRRDCDDLDLMRRIVEGSKWPT